jgi:hypothetical protein
MSGLVAALQATQGANSVPFSTMAILLLHSIALGTILVVFTYFQMKFLDRYQEKPLFEEESDEADAKHTKPADAPPPSANPPIAGERGPQPATTTSPSTALFLGSANLIFLCVGLTGFMLLLNNNLVRAFAIAAAIALVRFRVKLDQKSLNATLLFGILAGMACGLHEVMLAWALTITYILLFSLVMAFAVVINRESRAKRGGSSPSPAAQMAEARPPVLVPASTGSPLVRG